MTAPFRRIAVLDIGKTNAKVVVLDAESGAEIAAVKIGNAVLRDGPYPHYDIGALWNFAIEALTGFAAAPGFDAVSITTHGACAALLDADGILALPVLDYEHPYDPAIRAEYLSLRPDFSETFSPSLSAGLNLGAQLHYQKKAFPDAFARVATILTYPQYWAFRLTGVAANEVTSLGCHTDLWLPRSAAYSPLVDRIGIRSRMAPLRSAFEALGPISAAVAQQIGIGAEVPVYCGIHDSNASLLPHLIGRSAPFAVVSTGTWVVSFAVGGDMDHLDPGRDALANVDAYGRAVPSARFMGGREFEVLTKTIGEIPPEAAEQALAGVVERGLMLLPNVVPGSGPFPGRTMRWMNDEGATASERSAAASLYLALMTQSCLDLIGAGGRILVEGPFALNRIYVAALAALTGLDVVALPGSTGTSLGAALLTGIVPKTAPARLQEPSPLPSLSRYRDLWIAGARA
ncbi:FGGY-family carbohydrate kinase [Rhizobium sp. HT1-10]|uniref:FGGY-family carbohydrate kinase n=1 Tax=Rhizobium sp. HT1-10 TaxID=3111638 RepID=UPI003C202198